MKTVDIVTVGLILIVLGGTAFALHSEALKKEEWKDIGTLESIEVLPSWNHRFRIQSQSHGEISLVDGPSGNMTFPITFGCSGYTLNGHVGDTVGIIYRRGCLYEIRLLLKA